MSLWKTLWIEQCFNFRAISSIKGELIPYLVNKQFQEHKNVDREVTGTAEKKCLNQESGNSKIGKHPSGQLVRLINLAVNFHHKHFIDPTNCPWVSKDVYFSAILMAELLSWSFKIHWNVLSVPSKFNFLNEKGTSPSLYPLPHAAVPHEKKPFNLLLSATWFFPLIP